MKREVRGATSQRAEVVLRARDGVETTATMITTWLGKGADALTRSIVYVASASEQALRRASAIRNAGCGEQVRLARGRYDVHRCAIRRRASRWRRR